MCIGLSIQQISTFLTVFVAFLAVFIAFSQMRIAREKLRFDIYAKRFEIYKNCVIYYIAVNEKKSNDEIKKSKELFTISMRESLFLFDDKKGIHSELKNFSQVMEKFKYKIENNHPVDPIDAENSLLNIEEKMKNYILFNKFSKWMV